MEFLEKLKEELKPKAVYVISGPFDSETLLIVMDEERIEKVEELLEREDVDYDVAVVDPEEFEKMRDSVEKRGRRLW